MRFDIVGDVLLSAEGFGVEIISRIDDCIKVD